jgi:LuxR family transcriptional regulator, quorum-sensing system regulator SdiA
MGRTNRKSSSFASPEKGRFGAHMTIQTRIPGLSPFSHLNGEDVIWDQLCKLAADRYGITSVLYAFTHSRFTASRTGITSSVFLRHNLPDDLLESYPEGLSLDDDIATALILNGEMEVLWSDFDDMALSPRQREERETKRRLRLDVGVTFGFRFGGNSGFGGTCWYKRGASAEDFHVLWRRHRLDMLQLAQHFDAAMRPAMVQERFKLTPRERDVMSYSAGGMTAKQIAEYLRLSPKTVVNTLERARKTMEAVSTMEAVAKALIYELIG